MLQTPNRNVCNDYVGNPHYSLLDELAGIMQKAGPGVEDALFKTLVHLGQIRYLCVTGYFTGATKAPTVMLVVGQVNENR